MFEVRGTEIRKRNDVESHLTSGRFHSAEMNVECRKFLFFLLKYPVPFISGTHQSARSHFSRDVTLALR